MLSRIFTGTTALNQIIHNQLVKRRFNFKAILVFGIGFLLQVNSHSQPISAHAISDQDVSTKTGFVIDYQGSKIANKIVRTLYQHKTVEDDAWVQDNLAQLLNKINVVAREKALYKTFVLKPTDINAFATPGGIIAVNKGLITQASNVDELVSVLAHEVAHISQQHFLRRQDNFKYDGLIQLGGMLSAMLLSKQNNELASAVLLGSQAYVADNRLAYSREQEKEADRIGMKIMHKAGFDASAMASFFYQLGRYKGYGADVPEFLLTHPLTKKRLSEAQLNAQQLPFKNSEAHEYASKQFQFIKWQLKTEKKTVEAYEKGKLTYADNIEKSAIYLGLAEYYVNSTNKDKYKQAQKLLDELDEAYADDNLTLLIQAEIYISQSLTSKAEEVLSKAIVLYPNSRAVRLKLAHVYRLNEKPLKALSVLQEKLDQYHNDLDYWQALDKTLTVMPDSNNNAYKILSLRYYAEVVFWQNDLKTALSVLEKAKQLAEKSPSHLAKIKKRHAEIEALL